MPWPLTGATQYHVQLGLADKDLETLDLLNGLALGYYQLSPEV